MILCDIILCRTILDDIIWYHMKSYMIFGCMCDEMDAQEGNNANICLDALSNERPSGWKC